MPAIPRMIIIESSVIIILIPELVLHHKEEHAFLPDHDESYQEQEGDDGDGRI